MFPHTTQNSLLRRERVSGRICGVDDLEVYPHRKSGPKRAHNKKFLSLLSIPVRLEDIAYGNIPFGAASGRIFLL